MTAEPVQSLDPWLDHEGPWMEEEYLALPEVDGMRVELLDGDLIMSPWPDNAHQRLVRDLCAVLDRQAPDGYEALPGGNVRLETGRILIPDTFLTTIADRLVNDVVDVPLVAEVVSEHGKVRDRILKPALYAAAGIRWYLRVERWPDLTLVLHGLEGEAYVEYASAGRGGRLEVPDLGISIDVATLSERRSR